MAIHAKATLRWAASNRPSLMKAALSTRFCGASFVSGQTSIRSIRGMPEIGSPLGSRGPRSGGSAHSYVRPGTALQDATTVLSVPRCTGLCIDPPLVLKQCSAVLYHVTTPNNCALAARDVPVGRFRFAGKLRHRTRCRRLPLL